MKVGDIIWRFDENCRVYAKNAEGRFFGAPIYREYWRPMVITGENRRSWLLGPRWKPQLFKVPKVGEHRGWCFTQEEIDDSCWVWDYSNAIQDAVGRVRDAATLRAIAKLIGWKPSTPRAEAELRKGEE